ncbi:metallophosphoesterase [Mesobacillus zeae]|uniref:Metallophosphoesterase n=2 Tax=Mesobacillus zeae TaxID=1917180 RepID=A0A398BF12_9BACI|nr:metallophosphoesterase [Mesobacillus zeae]
MVTMVMLIAAVALAFYMLREAFADRVMTETFVFPDFPSSFGDVTIFFITDIHRRKVSASIIEHAKGLADIVLIGGDLAEKGVHFSRVEENIKKLKEIAPVYFVWGNNDYELDPHEMDALLLSLGVKILDNTAVKFESAAGDAFALLGVDDLTAGRCQLEYALEDAGNVPFRILACHNPGISSSIEEGSGIRLILSGHTHGGQIRIFNYGPYEKGGLKEAGPVSCFVSNGYGTTLIPLRLGAKAETHLITLKHG